MLQQGNDLCRTFHGCRAAPSDHPRIRSCAENDSALFPVSNSRGALGQPMSYTITDANGTVVGQGTFMLGEGEDVNIPISGVFGTLTFTPLARVGAVTSAMECRQLPTCGEMLQTGANGFPFIDISNCMTIVDTSRMETH
jgi:hypothetical protein